MSDVDPGADIAPETPPCAAETSASVDEGQRTDPVACAACGASSRLGAWHQVARFVVPGTPVPQPRPRVYERHTVSDSPRSRAWKRAVARAASDARCGAFREPLRVDLVFAMPRPQRLMRRASPRGPIPHAVRPDIDNLAKGVLDGLYVVFANDALVVSLTATKVWTAIGDETGCLVTISIL